MMMICQCVYFFCIKFLAKILVLRHFKRNENFKDNMVFLQDNSLVILHTLIYYKLKYTVSYCLNAKYTIFVPLYFKFGVEEN